MSVPQALDCAGLVLDYRDGGSKLVVSDAQQDGCGIRNRGGEALANLLQQDRQIRALDLRESNISDDGVAALCLTLRQTDQLEELQLSPVGHAGLEFLLGVVRRCERLQVVSTTVQDVPTLHVNRQNLAKVDYDTSSHKKEPPKEGEEEEEEAEEEQEPPPPEEDDEDEPEERERKKMEKLRKLWADNDYDSGDEGSRPKPAAAVASATGTSSTLRRLLSDFVQVVWNKENLTTVECNGEAVPADLKLDLSKAVDQHREIQERKLHQHEEKGARTAHHALKDQMQELCASLEASGDLAEVLPGEDGTAVTRLGARSFVGRRLFSALGEALFECQRFKSKENESVSEANGEMAFIAMYLRKHAKAAKEEVNDKEKKKRGGT